MEKQTNQEQGYNLNEIIGLMQVKIDAANSQILHLGLLVEYLYKELEEKKVGLDLESYPTWAQERFEEIKKINETETGKGIQEAMQKEMEEIAKNIKL
tara:strand:+ start:38 stop:331 length:294 start_codon:yes stop_codon:yes gene_type:complete